MDPDRLAELLDRHAAALGLYAAQWTTAADDVVQEAFIRLVEADPPPARPVPWLYKVVRNAALSARRSDVRRRRREANVAERLTTDGFAGLTGVEVADALERLEAESREVVVAHLWGGLTFGDIAEVTGVSSSAAHRRYRTALDELRKLLDQPCENRTR